MRLKLPMLAAAATFAVVLAGCGGDDEGAGGCTPVDAQVTVGANDDLSFDKDSYTSGPGCIEFTYRNSGGLAHTLLVRGESGFKLSVGTEDEGTIELESGTYELYCDVAGHEAGGMKAPLTVG